MHPFYFKHRTHVDFSLTEYPAYSSHRDRNMPTPYVVEHSEIFLPDTALSCGTEVAYPIRVKMTEDARWLYHSLCSATDIGREARDASLQLSLQDM